MTRPQMLFEIASILTSYRGYGKNEEEAFGGNFDVRFEFRKGAVRRMGVVAATENTEAEASEKAILWLELEALRRKQAKGASRPSKAAIVTELIRRARREQSGEGNEGGGR